MVMALFFLSGGADISGNPIALPPFAAPPCAQPTQQIESIEK